MLIFMQNPLRRSLTWIYLIFLLMISNIIMYSLIKLMYIYYIGTVA